MRKAERQVRNLLVVGVSLPTGGTYVRFASSGRYKPIEERLSMLHLFYERLVNLMIDVIDFLRVKALEWMWSYHRRHKCMGRMGIECSTCHVYRQKLHLERQSTNPPTATASYRR